MKPFTRRWGCKGGGFIKADNGSGVMSDEL
jgi:hypothetical protein